jgi:ribulose bisphosphate carboxylase small subunit
MTMTHKTRQSLRSTITALAPWRTTARTLAPRQTEDRLHQLLTQGVPITFEIASDGGARTDLGHSVGPSPLNELHYGTVG